MRTVRHWPLGAKLSLVAAPFLLVAILSIAMLVWMSLQLEGGAAAVNEAGRMRMQAYRMVLSVGTGDTQALPKQVAEFEASLQLLRQGDPERPLFVPWDATVRQRFAAVEQDWTRFRDRFAVGDAAIVVGGPGGRCRGVRLAHRRLGGRHRDAPVALDSLLHLLQIGLMALAVVGAAVLVYVGYLFVLEPVGLLKQAIASPAGRRPGRARRLHQHRRVRHAGRRLQRHGRAAAVDVPPPGEPRAREDRATARKSASGWKASTTSPTWSPRAPTLDELTAGFTQSVRRIARADGVALRWSDETNRALPDAGLATGLPPAMVEAEHCVMAGDCHCGVADAPTGARVIPIRTMQPARMQHCAQAGFETVVSVPIRLHERLMGEVDLFFHAQVDVSEAERSLLEALTAQLAGAMENLRLQRAGEGGRGVAGAQLPGARTARLDRAVAGLPEDPGAADARRAGQRRPAAGAARARRDRRRRARELRRRARAADAFPHPRQRRGHRAGAA